MYPPGGQQNSIARLNVESVTLFHFVRQKYLVVILLAVPLLVRSQILVSGLDQIEDLVALDQVVPDGRAAEINVKISVGICRADQTIFLHLGLDNVHGF